MSSRFSVAIETDYSHRSEGFRRELSRLEDDGRFDVRILRGPNAPHSESVEAKELAGVDFYILMGHRTVGAASFKGNDRLKWIGRFGAGFENVAIDDCTERGIILSNAPFGIREPVAELVMSFILALSTRLTFFDRYIRQNHFSDKGRYMTRCIEGATLGLIGCGGIAQTVVRLAEPFGMTVIASDPFADADAMKRKGIEIRSLEEVLRASDYVSVHVPLTEGTRGLLTERHFRMMKPTACFINTSRGGLYPDAVLAKVLNEGVIAGAGIDVFEDEPDVAGNPLLECETAILTPHIAGAINNADAVRMVMKANVDSIFMMVDGGLPDSIVNPEALSGPVPTEKISPSFKP